MGGRANQNRAISRKTNHGSVVFLFDMFAAALSILAAAHLLAPDFAIAVALARDAFSPFIGHSLGKQLPKNSGARC